MKYFSLIEALDKYCAYHDQAELLIVNRFRDLISMYPNCFERDCWSGHITSSAWILDPSQRNILLTLHRKLGIWCQLGGHSDGDRNTPNVALREAFEESGLQLVLIDSDIFDLDIHQIPAYENEPAHLHYDVRFLMQSKNKDFTISDESIGLDWIPITAIEEISRERSIIRMRDKWLRYVNKGV